MVMYVLSARCPHAATASLLLLPMLRWAPPPASQPLMVGSGAASGDSAADREPLLAGQSLATQQLRFMQVGLQADQGLASALQ